jgi:hypothetical protein
MGYALGEPFANLKRKSIAKRQLSSTNSARLSRFSLATHRPICDNDYVGDVDAMD